MTKKGFIISVDAFIALLLFFAIFAASTYYLGTAKFSAKNTILLKESAMDALTVLEKNGSLEKAIKENKPNYIRGFANRLPASLCAEVSIFGQNNMAEPVMTVLKSGCKKNFTEPATINKSVAARTGNAADYYIARITAWQKVSG